MADDAELGGASRRQRRGNLQEPIEVDAALEELREAVALIDRQPALARRHEAEMPLGQRHAFGVRDGTKDARTAACRDAFANPARVSLTAGAVRDDRRQLQIQIELLEAEHDG